MLQKYKNLLLHTNLFIESVNAKKEDLYFQEMYYRDILDYLFSKYNLCLLGTKEQKAEIIARNIGISNYFEYFYNSPKQIITIEDYYRIMQQLYCSDYTKYVAIGKNTNNEITEATNCRIATCMISDYYEMPTTDTTYNVNRLEKIKILL